MSQKNKIAYLLESRGYNNDILFGWSMHVTYYVCVLICRLCKLSNIDFKRWERWDDLFFILIQLA